MNKRLAIVLVTLGVVVGLGIGAVAAFKFYNPNAAPTSFSDTIPLGPPEQNDYIILIAEAYSGDHNLSLARDRLERLGDNETPKRVERLAAEYASQQDLIATNLAVLAVALGSKNQRLIGLSARTIVGWTPTAPIALSRNPELAYALKNAPTPPLDTPAPPAYIVVPGDQPYVVVAGEGEATGTPTSAFVIVPGDQQFVVVPGATRTPRPFTPVPQATPTSVPKPLPGTAFDPPLSEWFGGVSLQQADPPVGTGYWHLTHAIYCDAFDHSDDRRNNYGCEEELAGGGTGTNIYVMSDGNPIQVIAGDGRDVSNDPTIIGDLKAPGDMCQCTYSFESAPYRISVQGAPSDSIAGFCLCSKNFGWGSHAHVRYFLYFEYITRE